jgi:hypothetical protein
LPALMKMVTKKIKEKASFGDKLEKLFGKLKKS